MLNLDTLLSCRKDYQLERWINFARSWGIDETEKNYYEEDAKRQITVWGGPIYRNMQQSFGAVWLRIITLHDGKIILIQ